MNRFAALGTVAVLSCATAASALTFTPTQDNRQIYAGTVIFSDTDGDTKTPLSAFSTFDDQVWANSDYDGFFANAHADQFSELGSMYIQGSGFAEAQIGVSFDNWQTSNAEADTGGSGITMQSNDVSGGSQSLLEILFSIDMDAHYDLSGSIGAGIQEASGTIDYGSNQSTSVVLFDIDHGIALVDESVMDGDQDISTSGHLGPGNYRFTVDASVEVFGTASEADNSLTQGPPGGDIYSVNAGFEGINLTLSSRDKPIPEPVTTTLAGLGLGALAFQTTKRRRA